MEQLEYWQAIEDGAEIAEEPKKKKKKSKKDKKKVKAPAELTDELLKEGSEAIEVSASQPNLNR